MKDRDESEFQNELYEVSSTFGITYSISGEKMIEFIDPEIKFIQWYIQNDHELVAESVCTYIVGYLLFNHTPPKPAFQLFHLYYQVLESQYFHDLGFKRLFDPQTSIFEKDRIRQVLNEIDNTNKEEYPQLTLSKVSFNYNNIVGFARSFVLMLRTLDFTPKEKDEI